MSLTLYLTIALIFFNIGVFTYIFQPNLKYYLNIQDPIDTAGAILPLTVFSLAWILVFPLLLFVLAAEYLIKTKENPAEESEA